MRNPLRPAPFTHRQSALRVADESFEDLIARAVVREVRVVEDGGAAPTAAERVHFTGRLEHDDLPLLLPACEAQVMPSTFPESFGMVAAEAAACGALPLSANHSGMAEVTATLRPALPGRLRHLMSFDVGPGAVREIGSKLVEWLELDPDERRRARAALAAEAARRYSWESVARGVVAAASGQSNG